jgi:hypothetical protein
VQKVEAASDTQTVGGCATPPQGGGGARTPLYKRLPWALRRQLVAPPTSEEAALRDLAQYVWNLHAYCPRTDVWVQLKCADEVPSSDRKQVSHYGAVPPAPDAAPPKRSKEPLQWRDMGNATYEHWLDFFLLCLAWLRKDVFRLKNYEWYTNVGRRREYAGDVVESILGGSLLTAGLMTAGDFDHINWDLRYVAEPQNVVEGALNFLSRFITCLLSFENYCEMRYANKQWWVGWSPQDEAKKVFDAVLPCLQKVVSWSEDGFEKHYRGDRPEKARSVAGAERHRARDQRRAEQRRAKSKAGARGAGTPPQGGGASSSTAPCVAQLSPPPQGGGASSSSAPCATPPPPQGGTFSERREAARKRLLAPTSSEGDTE